MNTDSRFEEALANCAEFDDKLGKFRRIGNTLIKALEEVSRDLSQSVRDGAVVAVPIGARNHPAYEVVVCFGKKSEVEILLYNNNTKIPHDQVTLYDLRVIFENPSPILDAAARFSRELGRFDEFRKRMYRFNIMHFNA